MAEGGARALRTRSAPAAFGRGISQVAANPGLLLAPLAFGGAVFAAVAAAAFAAILAYGRVFRAAARLVERGPGGILDALDDLKSRALSAPLALIAALLGALAILLVLTAAAAWVRAGVTGSLAEADARAAEGAALAAFEHPSLAAAFFQAASRHFGGFFALVNLYALVGSFLAVLLVAPAVGALAAVAARRTGLLMACGLLFAVLVPTAIVASAALRVVYLAAGRAIAVEGLDALDATGRAIALVGESPGRTAVLYLLGIGGAMAVGVAFVVPRMVLTFAAGSLRAGVWAPLVVSGAFMVLQVAAGFAYELAVTGSFVALWPQESAFDGAPSAPEVPPP